DPTGDPTSAPTEPELPPVDGIQNGGFETGLDGWVRSNTASLSSHRHEGSRAARLGAASATRGDSILSQTFTVPTDRSKLSVWWQGRCSDKVRKGWAGGFVKNNTTGELSTLLAPTCANGSDWRSAEVAVTPGQSYTVQLVSHDATKRTRNRTYFDDVRLS
ncbi:MAG: hypothetical protein ACJ72K_04335, partial [Friedmanniella sp.]